MFVGFRNRNAKNNLNIIDYYFSLLTDLKLDNNPSKIVKMEFVTGNNISKF